MSRHRRLNSYFWKESTSVLTPVTYFFKQKVTFFKRKVETLKLRLRFDFLHEDSFFQNLGTYLQPGSFCVCFGFTVLRSLCTWSAASPKTSFRRSSGCPQVCQSSYQAGLKLEINRATKGLSWWYVRLKTNTPSIYINTFRMAILWTKTDERR